MKDKKTQSQQEQERVGWFEAYTSMKNVSKPPSPGVLYPCPCCGFKTLSERGGFDICPVCFWEDDGQDDHDADLVRGGPNYSLSLSQARKNFREFGACERKHIKNVRKPLPEEQPREPNNGDTPNTHSPSAQGVGGR